MKVRGFFAAANGYDGFRSYFGTVFCSEDFDRVFILKGGPGTGKSTLMRRIAGLAENADMNVAEIFCSSDPDSLDGVIIHSGQKSFAILDGTAPHVREPEVPGAIDTLIDLGQGFDVERLKLHRAEILALGKTKKNLYAEAYATLRAAGAINARIKEIIQKSFDYDSAEETARKLIRSNDTRNATAGIALRRAFCRHGYVEAVGFLPPCDRIAIRGEFGEEMELLNMLQKILGEKSAIISYDPLDRYSCDTVITEGASYLTTAGDGDLDAGAFLTSSADRTKLADLREARNSLLNNAKDYLNEASKTHSELEKIYSAAIDFEHNNTLLEKIINCIL